MVAGRDAATFGEAKNSWLTGTAAWTFVDVSQYILGIQPTLAGLKIDPCIPHEMDGFTLRAEVVEVREKPTYPIGEFAIDAFGRKPVYVDRGIRRRAILALGRADVGELESLIPREAGLTVIGGSSDHCIVDVEDCPRRLEVGDIVEFSLCYSHLLYATSRSDITIQFVN